MKVRTRVEYPFGKDKIGSFSGASFFMSRIQPDQHLNKQEFFHYDRTKRFTPSKWGKTVFDHGTGTYKNGKKVSD